MSDTPQRITVADARALADKGEKAWVIILAVAGDGTQFTTWGRTPEDKVAASDLSEELGEYLCGGPDRAPPVVYESFKLDAAKNKARVEELEAAIRAHRDQRGDDRCWLDDETLYRVLPEGFTPPSRDTTVELDNCQRFIRCRSNPNTQYLSPQRRIEELEALVESLTALLEADNTRMQTIIQGLTDRVAAQSELLSKRAEAG